MISDKEAQDLFVFVCFYLIKLIVIKLCINLASVPLQVSLIIYLVYIQVVDI